MVLQAFIDDSRGEDGTFVLAGHIATAENWVLFSKEWEELLPYGVRNKDGNYHFKMAQMAANPERMARVSAFFRIIEKYIMLSISCKIQVNDLPRARSRLHVPNLAIDYGDMVNPYLVAFRALLDMFHNNKEKMVEFLPLDQAVDFIFDEQAEKKIILSAWDSYLAGRPRESRKHFGATPIFRDDTKCLPLQAADLWAWWAREWYENDRNFLDFGTMKRNRSPYPVLRIEMDEDAIFSAYASMARDGIEKGRPIFDIKFNADF